MTERLLAITYRRGNVLPVTRFLGQNSTPNDDVNDHTLRVQKIKADYQHSIDFLSNGIRHNWTAKDYRSAMEGSHIGACNAYIQMILQPKEMWDERMPFNVEVKETLTRCRNERDMVASTLNTRPEAK